MSSSWANELSRFYPDNKVHVANMGPTWVLSAPGGPHVGPVNLAIRVCMAGQIVCQLVSYGFFMPGAFFYKLWWCLS